MKILPSALVAGVALALCGGAGSAGPGQSILFASDYGQARQPEIYQTIGMGGKRAIIDTSVSATESVVSQ